VIVLAFDAWVLRDPRWPVRLGRVYAPAMLAIASVAAWRLTDAATGVVPPRGAIANLLAQSRVIWRYVAMLIVPRGQALVHDVQWPGTTFDPVSIVLLLALMGAVGLAIRMRHTYPLAAFGVIWFVGVLAPTSSLIPVRDAMAEPRLYLASAGLLLAAASLTCRAIAERRTIRIALTVAVAVLAIVTYRRNALWSNPMDLWKEAVRRAPASWQSHWGYAEVLREIGQCDRARPEYDLVLRLNPDHAGARAGLDRCVP
jgi:hypothetical protein